MRWAVPLLLSTSLHLCGCITTLWGVAVAGEVQEIREDQARYCDIPCGARQTCDAPFEAEDTCAVINVARSRWQMHWGGDPYGRTRGLTVSWEPSEDPRRIIPGTGYHGLSETGLYVRVAYLPDDRPEQTALAHEVTHQIMRYERGTFDHGHERPEWCVLEGCEDG